MQPALELVTFDPAARTPQPPFWGRCARAGAMLLIASAAHQWLLPPAASPLPGAPISARRAPLAPPSTKLIAGMTDTVQIVSELVEAIGDSTPVGTTGLVPPSFAPAVRASATQTGDSSTNVAAVMEAPLPSQPEPELQPASLSVSPVELPGEAGSVPPPAPPDVALAVAKRPLSAPVPVDEQQLVRRLLEQYAEAYERLDVNAAKALWPTLDDKALRRAFAQLATQQVKFDSCGITIDGRDAHARCAGQASYRPRIGSRELRIATREWTFDLAQAQNGWRIVDARVR